MKWAQVTQLVLYAVTLLLGAHYHGKPRTGQHNFWGSLFASACLFGLLYCAGAFSKVLP